MGSTSSYQLGVAKYANELNEIVILNQVRVEG